MEPKTIMVGIERTGEESRDAIALAAVFARAYDEPLVLAGVYPSMLAPGAHGYTDVMREPTEVDLRTARAFVPGDVDAVTRVVGSTSVVRGLHQAAEELETRILVLGPTHVGAVSRAFGNDIAMGLLRAAPCAVAIAAEGAARSDGQPMTIGVAYVHTEEGRDALDEGIDLARRTGGHLRILNVPDAWDFPSDLDRPLRELMLEQSARDLDDALQVVDGRVPVETVQLEGQAVEELRLAANDLDILIMGSRAYGPVRRVLLGSVSSQLVHGASCPVLVIPRGARVPITG